MQVFRGICSYFFPEKSGKHVLEIKKSNLMYKKKAVLKRSERQNADKNSRSYWQNSSVDVKLNYFKSFGFNKTFCGGIKNSPSFSKKVFGRKNSPTCCGHLPPMLSLLRELILLISSLTSVFFN